MIAKFRKKPVEVEAIRYNEWNFVTVHDFLGDAFWKCDKCGGYGEYEGEYGPISCQLCNSSLMPIKTLDSVAYADWGDWIIKGTAGEFYPCKPDIFEQTYEAVQG